MTIGSTIRDGRTPFQTYELYPAGDRIDGAINSVGLYQSRGWNGTDYPVVRPTYEVYEYFSSDNLRLRGRRRLDVPKRSRTDDHNYSVDFYESNNTRSDTQTLFWQPDGSTPPVYRWVLQYTQVSTTGPGFSFSVVTDSLWNANDSISLIGKLRTQIAGSDFNAGVFLGEGRQALAMIADSATRIFRAYKYTKRGDLRNAALQLKIKNLRTSNRRLYFRETPLLKRKKPSLKDRQTAKDKVASDWLQLQYGWLPLIKDAQGAAQFLAKHLEFPMVQNYTVRRTKPGEVSNGGQTNAGQWFVAYNRQQIIARVQESSTVQLVGLADVASVAWELLPFSFIADWFIPIGNYLAARSLPSGLTGVFVTTTKTVFNAGYASRSTVKTESTWINPIAFGYYEKRTSLSRTVSTTLDVPLPRFKSLSDVPSWKRAANAIALITLLGGKRNP